MFGEMFGYKPPKRMDEFLGKAKRGEEPGVRPAADPDSQPKGRQELPRSGGAGARSSAGSGTAGHARVLEALDAPWQWSSLSDDELKMLVFLLCARVGVNPSKGRGEVEPAFGLLQQRISVAERLQLLTRVTEFAEEGRTGWTAMLPWMLCEQEVGVATTAVINAAMLIPQQGGDELSGPRLLMAMYDQSGSDSRQRMVILGGLILLGDERILPLVKGRWRDIAPFQLRRELAMVSSGVVCTLQLEFLLEWLESAESDSEFGRVAGGIASLVQGATIPHVLRQRRCFPASAAGGGPAVEVVEEISFPEYARRMRQRLAKVIERESEPRVLPTMLAMWEEAE